MTSEHVEQTPVPAESHVTLPSPEGIIRRDHIAVMLSEDGPYSVSKSLMSTYRDSDPSIRNRFLADLDLVVNLVGKDKLGDAIKAASVSHDDQTENNKANKRALSIYFPKKDVDGWKESGRAKKIEGYANIADAFINSYMRAGVWEPHSQKTDLSEEVESTNSIPGLLNLVFSANYSERVRFEAKRKLVLMSLAASIDTRSDELKEQDRYPEFTRFLNEYIWHKEAGGTGATRQIDLLSRHDYDTYKVLGVEELITDQEKSEATKRLTHHKPRKGGYYLRRTPFNQRHIKYKGEIIPVYQDSRQKQLLSRMGKMIRKGEEDPAVAVQDTTGLLMVVPDIDSAYKLFRHLASGGNSRSSLIKIEEIEDTLDGTSYSAKNKGSSSKIRQLKFIARQGGMSLEMVIHTYDSYLDYQHQDEVAHEEYEINRVVDSGAFGLLFPEKIYGVSNDEAKNTIEYLRRLRRVPQV